jgi:hypothetical protein
MANLKNNPTKHELILYSDGDWPDTIRVKSPEFLKEAKFESGPNIGKPNPFAIHNCCFLAGLKMCRERGASHALYLEQDCRVLGQHWDDRIFSEYFSIGRPFIVAGTVSIYNPTGNGLAGAKAFQRLIANPPAHGIPTGCFGWAPSSTVITPTFFPNGALCIYDVPWMLSLFDVEAQGAMASQNTAFDMAIGARIYELFGLDAFSLIGSLGSIYSGYGDALTTPDQRRELLTSGKVAAMHQEKTDWVP